MTIQVPDVGGESPKPKHDEIATNVVSAALIARAVAERLKIMGIIEGTSEERKLARIKTAIPNLSCHCEPRTLFPRRSNLQATVEIAHQQVSAQKTRLAMKYLELLE